jgi:hypothetical protein
MSETVTAPTPSITGNVAGMNSGETITTTTIDEAQYHTAPAELFPTTVKEEIAQTNQYYANENGDQYFLNNTNLAFQKPGYSEVFQAKTECSM